MPVDYNTYLNKDEWYHDGLIEKLIEATAIQAGAPQSVKEAQLAQDIPPQARTVYFGLFSASNPYDPTKRQLYLPNLEFRLRNLFTRDKSKQLQNFICTIHTGDHYFTLAFNCKGEILIINTLPGYKENYEIPFIKMVANLLRNEGIDVSDEKVTMISPSSSRQFPSQKDASSCGPLTAYSAACIDPTRSLMEQKAHIIAALSQAVARSNELRWYQVQVLNAMQEKIELAQDAPEEVESNLQQAVGNYEKAFPPVSKLPLNMLPPDEKGKNSKNKSNRHSSKQVIEKASSRKERSSNNQALKFFDNKQNRIELLAQATVKKFTAIKDRILEDIKRKVGEITDLILKKETSQLIVQETPEVSSAVDIQYEEKHIKLSSDYKEEHPKKLHAMVAFLKHNLPENRPPFIYYQLGSKINTSAIQGNLVDIILHHELIPMPPKGQEKAFFQTLDEARLKYCALRLETFLKSAVEKNDRSIKKAATIKDIIDECLKAKTAAPAAKP